MRTLWGVFCLVLLMGSLAACNTVEGMGRDIRGAGEAITGSAKKTKEEIR